MLTMTKTSDTCYNFYLYDGANLNNYCTLYKDGVIGWKISWESASKKTGSSELYDYSVDPQRHMDYIFRHYNTPPEGTIPEKTELQGLVLKPDDILVLKFDKSVSVNDRQIIEKQVRDDKRISNIIIFLSHNLDIVSVLRVETTKITI